MLTSHSHCYPYISHYLHFPNNPSLPAPLARTLMCLVNTRHKDAVVAFLDALMTVSYPGRTFLVTEGLAWRLRELGVNASDRGGFPWRTGRALTLPAPRQTSAWRISWGVLPVSWPRGVPYLLATQSFLAPSPLPTQHLTDQGRERQTDLSRRLQMLVLEGIRRDFCKKDKLQIVTGARFDMKTKGHR